MAATESIKDIMNTPIGIQKNNKIIDAIKNILIHQIGRIIIYDSKKPVGIISEKDILNFLFKDKKHRSIAKIPASEIMNDIYYADDSMTKSEAAHFMLDKKCSSVAVGSSQNFQGIVTKTDLTKYYAEELREKNKVSEWMSLHYFSVYTNDPLYEVIKTMLGFGISRMMIVDNDKQPAGIISTGDVFRNILRNATLNQTKENTKSDDDEFWSRYKYFCAQSAGKIMTPNIIKIKANEDLAKASELMIKRKINAVGVEDTDERLAGIVGKRDVLLAIASMN